MVLVIIFCVLNVLYFYVSTFESVCVVPSMAVFFSSLIMFSWFVAQVFSVWFLDGSSLPVITFVFTFHMRCISIVRPLYFRSFSASFLITYLSLKLHLLTYIFLFITTRYDVKLIVRDGSVSLHLLILYYDYLTFMTSFNWFWYMVKPVFIV